MTVFRMQPTEPQLIVPLDNCTLQEARELVGELQAAGVRWFKVGLELYTQTGPLFVRELKERGLSVFLDLKLHDIPNTVAKAVKAAVATGADLATVHCSGGREMLAAAQNAAQGSALSLLGVTVLTSLGGEGFDEICEVYTRAKARVPRRSGFTTGPTSKQSGAARNSLLRVRSSQW